MGLMHLLCVVSKSDAKRAGATTQIPLDGTAQTFEKRRASFSRVRKEHMYDSSQPSHGQSGPYATSRNL
jgi:hypothetical protein